MNKKNSVERLLQLLLEAENETKDIHEKLSELNLKTFKGTVSQSATKAISKRLDGLNEEISITYLLHKIPEGWLDLATYTQNLRKYSGMDELDKDLDFLRAAEVWLLQSRAYLEFLQDLFSLSEEINSPSSATIEELSSRYSAKINEITKKKLALLKLIIMNAPQSEQVEAETKKTHELYVSEAHISSLEDIANQAFDLSKLISICKELNSCYKNECFYAVGMLLRSAVDHIPPIFGKQTFQEVANNHGTKSLKGSLTSLQTGMRNISDHYLHQTIRNRENNITKQQIEFRPQFDLLLSEIIRVLKN